MPQEMKAFSTLGMPDRRKAALWNSILCEFTDGLQVQPRDPLHFEGTLVRRRIGPIALFNVYCASVHIWHWGDPSRQTASQTYQLLMPVEGTLTVTYGGRAAVEVGSGSMLLVDQAERYEMTHGDGMRMIGVEFPRTMLEKVLPNASAHSGTVVCSDCGALRDLRDLLRRLGSGPSSGGPDVESIPSFMAYSIAELVAAIFATQPQPVIAKGHQVRARAFRAYIESRLGDDLKPLDVAQAFNVSERYMRLVFHSSGESFSALLLRLRHERAAELLRGRNQPRHNMKILDIALECGFKSDSHFCRSFKLHFLVTPREYRRT